MWVNVGFVGGDDNGLLLGLPDLGSMHCILGALHDSFTGLSGFVFRRKLNRTKTQQGTDKLSKHYRRTVFLWDLVFCTHQQKWSQFYFILSFIRFLKFCTIFHFLLVPPGNILILSPWSLSRALSIRGYTVATDAPASSKPGLIRRRRQNRCMEAIIDFPPRWDIVVRF